ncbi:MAG: LON peptidase substrate-binding domain-containing protein [Pyrinomonadaceae bacterium]
MSENTEKVLGVKFLPIFPLPVVLLPNELLPLHIFEPRYQQMLRDIGLEKNLFGVSYFDARETDSSKPETGSFGCAAEVRETQILAGGRSNIIAIGVMRYRLENYVEANEPYAVAEISFFEDDAEDENLIKPLADEVFALFMRIANAANDLSGARGKFPDLPQAEPQQLSFLVAAAFNLEAKLKYELLETRSTIERLERLREILRGSVEKIEDSAAIAKVAKTNGHSKKKINLE